MSNFFDAFVGCAQLGRAIADAVAHSFTNRNAARAGELPRPVPSGASGRARPANAALMLRWRRHR
jgi:hypothetical protein